MIAAEWKPIPELVAKLRGHKKVLVVGCATCVAECAAGGEREVQTIAPVLHMAMQQDGHPIEIQTATLERQCEEAFIEEIAKTVGEVDAVLSLACGIGVQALWRRYFPTPIYPAVNTCSLVVRESPGVWEARCEACGDCVLDQTFGICPIARCSKGLMNGPCGGTSNNSKCEVSDETDCAWALIVDRARQAGKLEQLMEFRSPKDYSNSRHGGPKRIVREDLQ